MEVNSRRIDADVLKRRIREEHKHSSEKRFLHRLHCVLLVGSGESSNEVAGQFGVSARTVNRWVKNYLERGIEGLQDGERSGRPSSLAADQLGKLACDLSRHPRIFGHLKNRWDASLLQRHIQLLFGVDLGLRQCQRLLHELKP
jgi:transposase